MLKQRMYNVLTGVHLNLLVGSWGYERMYSIVHTWLVDCSQHSYCVHSYTVYSRHRCYSALLTDALPLYGGLIAGLLDIAGKEKLPMLRIASLQLLLTLVDSREGKLSAAINVCNHHKAYARCEMSIA